MCADLFLKKWAKTVREGFDASWKGAVTALGFSQVLVVTS